jgi:serine/threonine-protein kinase
VEDRWPNAAAFRTALSELAAPLAPAAPNGSAGLPAPRPAGRLLMPADDVLPTLPPLLLPPVGMGRREWKQWAREQKRIARAATRGQPHAPVSGAEGPDADDVARRVVRFRRSIVQAITVVPILFLVNFAMQGFPWFIFPSAFLVLDVFGRAGSLWADGVSPIGALRGGWRERIRSTFGPGRSPAPPAIAGPPADPAASLVPADVLAGNYGGTVRRAAADRDQVKDIIAKLSPIEKELLPDVTPTVDGLVDRIASIAVTVHRLDADVSGSSLGALDERISGMEKSAVGPDVDRRLALLQRQRATLRDLLERRRTLVTQLESASLALQNLKLDLLKLRSAGMGASLEDVTSATREARALSRDIGHVLDAADDVRKL